MENIGKDKVLAAVVRTFFKYFTLGVIEGKSADSADMTVYEPKNVKKVMSEHIEDVSRIFNQEVFFAISRINYVGEELERELQAFVAAGNKTTPMDLMRFACRSDEFYDVMVSEYKRNFESLLCGSFATLSKSCEGFTECEALGSIAVDMAENIINRIAHQAYGEGKKLVAE